MSLHLATNHWFEDSTNSCCSPVFEAKTLTEKMHADVCYAPGQIGDYHGPITVHGILQTGVSLIMPYLVEHQCSSIAAELNAITNCQPHLL